MWGSGFEVMLALVLSMKINVKRTGRRLNSSIWAEQALSDWMLFKDPTQHQHSSKSMPSKQCMVKAPSNPHPYHTALAIKCEAGGHCPGSDPRNCRATRGSKYLYDDGCSSVEAVNTIGCHRARRRSHNRHSHCPWRVRWPSLNAIGQCSKAHCQFFQLPIREVKKRSSVKVMGKQYQACGDA